MVGKRTGKEAGRKTGKEGRAEGRKEDRAEGVFRQVFGTGTMPTGTSVPSPRGEGVF